MQMKVEANYNITFDSIHNRPRHRTTILQATSPWQVPSPTTTMSHSTIHHNLKGPTEDVRLSA